MTEPTAMNSNSSMDGIERIMAECLSLPEAQREEFLERTYREHPQVSQEIRRRFEALSAMGLASIDAPKDMDRHPQALGDFCLLERIGGGGMGVVYLAEQRSLGRRVALKVIRPEHVFFSGARDRFQREVEAVAQLHHPGIVPIHVVGREQGIPYFAMEYVQGCSLADLLHALNGRNPTSLTEDTFLAAFAECLGLPQSQLKGITGGWVQFCCRIVRQVAEALQHVHKKNILHRDIKPSNIMLTADGQPRLIDFGLTQSSEADRLTRSGSYLGTLLYMSSEQMRGKQSLDARTDVYSLGVMFYEMLALEVPFLGGDRLQTERLILKGTPASLRENNRMVGKELEAVCLKAMALERDRRYGSAREFAADLTNVLDKRPVAAQSPPIWLPVVRWFQRHPGFGLSGVLGLFFLVGTPTALLIQQRDHNTELETSLGKEIKAKEEALTKYRQHKAIKSFLLKAFAAADPGMAGRTEVTAKEILAQGKRLIGQGWLKDQPLTRADVFSTFGLISLNWMYLQEAVEFFEQGELAYTEAKASFEEQAEFFDRYADCLSAMEHWEQAENKYRTIMESSGELQKEPWRVAAAYSGLGDMYAKMGKLEEAETYLKRGLTDLQNEQTAPLAEIGFGWSHLGAFYLGQASSLTPDQRRDLPQQAERCYRKALDLYLQADDIHVFSLFDTKNALGLALKYQGRLEEAEGFYMEALEDSRALSPFNISHVVLLINISGLKQARYAYREAIDLLGEALPPLDKTVGFKHFNAAIARGNLAGLRFRAEDYAGAQEEFPSVIAIQRQNERIPKSFLASSYLRLGLSLVYAGKLKEGEVNIKEGKRLFAEHFGKNSPNYFPGLVGEFDLCMSRQEWQRAEELLQEMDDLVPDLQTNADYYWQKLQRKLIWYERAKDWSSVRKVWEELWKSVGALKPNHAVRIRAQFHQARMAFREGDRDRAGSVLLQAWIHSRGVLHPNGPTRIQLRALLDEIYPESRAIYAEHRSKFENTLIETESWLKPMPLDLKAEENLY